MGKFKFDNEKIILTSKDGLVQVFQIDRNPSYKVGTVYIEFNDDRYFLIS